MPRCSHCGKVNREGSLFCQDCGHKLDGSPAPQAPASSAGAAKAASGVCAACGTANPAGMNFCKMCGTSLAARSMTPAPVDAAKTSCSACGKQTPSGFAFCQHCGQRLAHAAPAARESPAPAQPAAPLPAPAPALEAAGRRAPTSPEAPSSRSSAAHVVSASAMGVAPTVAPQMPQMPQMLPTPPAGLPRPVVGASGLAPAHVNGDAAHAATAVASALPAAAATGRDTMTDAPALAVPRGTLVTVNRDGTDGQSCAIVGEAFDIGRLEGQLLFDGDPYLAPRHARLLTAGGKVVLRPIDQVNGVYVRIREAVDLAPGDQFLVGKELIRFEPLAPEERDPPSLVEHGVRIFGTIPREAWGRLRQLTVAGTTRDLWHLTRPELVLGREEGDVTFPDDEFMSRRHAAIQRHAGTARLEDLGSSNGTFLRVRRDRELSPGDVIRLGDQLLRFEG